MDYKEKYEMALEGIQEILDSGADSINMSRLKLRLQGIFPELKESEDDMIREEIVDYLKKFIPHCDDDLVAKSKVWISWLEKQGEQNPVGGNERETEINLVEILKHYPRETELYSPLYGKLWLAEVDEKNEIITCYKHCLDEGCTRAILEQEDTVSFYSNGTTGLPDYTISKDCMLFLYDIEKQDEQNHADKVESKFKTGDWIIKNNDSSIHIDYSCCKITKVENGNYTIESAYGYKGYNTFETFEKDYHLWTIEDAKDGDVLYSHDKNLLWIYKNTSTYYASMILDYAQYNRISTNCDIAIPLDTCPATKEQHDLLFQKMKEVGYVWDAEKKELKNIQQKPVVYAPKFRVGDKLVSTKNPRLSYEVLEVGHINELDNPEYKVEIFTDGKQQYPRNIHYMEYHKVDEWAKLIEQKHDWTEEDEKMYNSALQNATLTKERTDMKGLMIGDWVMYNPNVFIEDEYEPAKSWYATTIASGYDIDLAEEGCYEPIPLTEEFFEKNTIKKAAGYNYFMLFESEDKRIQVTTSGDGYWYVHVYNEDYVTIGGCDVKYVHQFQQLLRLCGYEMDVVV